MADPVLDPVVKDFVQNRLGCGCPEEVFENIVYGPITGPNSTKGLSVTIGERLLVWFTLFRPTPMHHGDHSYSAFVKDILKDGKDERDSRGLNRFRLVLVSDKGPGEEEGLLSITARAMEMLFEDGRDDKVHVHVMGLGNMPEEIRSLM